MGLIWFWYGFKDRNVPDTAEPLPRWTATGNGYHNLSLVPSVDCTKNKAGVVVRPEEWHGYITNGEVV